MEFVGNLCAVCVEFVWEFRMSLSGVCHDYFLQFHKSCRFLSVHSVDVRASLA